MTSTGVWLDVRNSKLIIDVAERVDVTMPDPAPRDHGVPCEFVAAYRDPKRVEIWLPEYVVKILEREGIEVLRSPAPEKGIVLNEDLSGHQKGSGEE